MRYPLLLVWNLKTTFQHRGTLSCWSLVELRYNYTLVGYIIASGRTFSNLFCRKSQSPIQPRTIFVPVVYKPQKNGNCFLPKTSLCLWSLK